jgi:hypothetical protein
MDICVKTGDKAATCTCQAREKHHPKEDAEQLPYIHGATLLFVRGRACCCDVYEPVTDLVTYLDIVACLRTGTCEGQFWFAHGLKEKVL